MADLTSITAVRPTANTQFRQVGFGATIAAGSTIYYDTTAVEYLLADCDNTVTTAAAHGIAITPGVDGGYGLLATGGSIILVGTTMAVGTTYIVSDTPGGIKPMADAASGDWVTILGTASTTTQLDLSVKATSVQVP